MFSSQQKALPQVPTEWLEAARLIYKHRLAQGLRAMCHTEYDSASKISDDQFYLLRALWRSEPASACDLKKIIHIKYVESARTWLKSQKAFFHYLEALDRRRQNAHLLIPSDTGVYALVLYQQDQVQWLAPEQVIDCNPKLNMTPRRITRSTMKRDPYDSPSDPGKVSRGRSKPLQSLNYNRTGGRISPDISDTLQAAKLSDDDTSQSSADSHGISPFSPFDPVQSRAATDEQIVNTALINLLAAVTMFRFPDAIWTLDRKAFKLRDLYQARTDGFLHRRGQDHALAILETKAHVRTANSRAIMKQEAAQMAAWIRQDARVGFFRNKDLPSTKHRLSISQDHREVYITVAKYNQEYERYLSETSRTEEDVPESSGAGKHRSRQQVPVPYSFEEGEKGPFLYMNCFGPWDIKNAEHVKDLARKIIALTDMLMHEA